MSLTKTKKRRKKTSKNMSSKNVKAIPSNISEVNNQKSQRALIFQGGGSLGAYEAGVFAVLYNWIKKDINDDENIFDIVAGTSIGAINATIITSHYLERKEELQRMGDQINHSICWEKAPKKLLDFWKYVSSSPNLYSEWMQNLTSYWLSWVKMNPYIKVPSNEAFRRYLTTRSSLIWGVPSVFLPLFFAPFPTQFSNKFFDSTPQFASWYRYTNQPLRQSIQKFASRLYNNGGIETYFDSDPRLSDPRLILISVDIEEGATVPFDSYRKPKDGRLKTEYYIKQIGDKESEKRCILYKNGITLDHVLASASVPKNFDYVEIMGKKFWDGGILSNTPLRETISEHISFWRDKQNLDSVQLRFESWTDKRENIPSLDVYIVNLHPAKETADNSLLNDYDAVKDRENDIRYHDMTDYDLKVATFVSDYVLFVTKMSNLAYELIKKQGKPNNMVDEFDKILQTPAESQQRSGSKRHYEDLIKNRFDINKIIKIERLDDADTISDKIVDFSPTTISFLITCGIRDALTQVISEFIKDIKNKKEDTFKNLDDRIGEEFSALLEEIKEDLTMQSYNNFNLISPELISRFHKKIDEYHDRLSAKQYNTLSKSIKGYRIKPRLYCMKKNIQWSSCQSPRFIQNTLLYVLIDSIFS